MESGVPVQLSKLESAILDWISVAQPWLAPELTRATVAKRNHTGAGLYVWLAAESSEWDRPPVDGPTIESRMLDSGGGCILWLSQGKASCLEVYSFGDAFPEHLEDFKLSPPPNAPSSPS